MCVHTHYTHTPHKPHTRTHTQPTPSYNFQNTSQLLTHQLEDVRKRVGQANTSLWIKRGTAHLLESRQGYKLSGKSKRGGGGGQRHGSWEQNGRRDTTSKIRLPTKKPQFTATQHTNNVTCRPQHIPKILSLFSDVTNNQIFRKTLKKGGYSP